MALYVQLFTVHNMEAVYLPTDASWLNAIESEFTALHAATLNNSDDCSTWLGMAGHADELSRLVLN